MTNETAGQAVGDLIKAAHEASGLTWDQISSLFGVSRRTVHLWASGGQVTARHAEMIAAFARMVDNAPEATPELRRAWLFSAEPGQPSPVEAFLAAYRAERTPIVGAGYTACQLLGADCEPVGVEILDGIRPASAGDRLAGVLSIQAAVRKIRRITLSASSRH